MKIITIIAEKATRQRLIVRLIEFFKANNTNNKAVFFAKHGEHLDIDTPHKDSYALFEAGLDFVMLVTDKQRYIKSRHDISDYLPIPPETEWVIQDGEVYPTDIYLTVNKDDTISTACGKQFPLEPLTPLLNWLEQYDD